MTRARIPVRFRGHVTSIVVTALSAVFATVLIMATGVIGAAVGAGSAGESGSVRSALLVVTSVFVIIALYVGAIVTANTFATIIAGRTRQIALLRLAGAQARSLRRAVPPRGSSSEPPEA